MAKRIGRGAGNIFAPMRSVVTKIQPELLAPPSSPNWASGAGLLPSGLKRLAWLALAAALALGGCHQKLNYRDGKYRSAREMVRLKKAGTRGSARPVGKVKGKTVAPTGAKTKVVTKRPAHAGNVSGTLATVIEAARSYQGTPYRYGGTTRLGLDCSGLLQLSFGEAGVAIPRSSNEQAVWGEPVKSTELRPGDLVFFGASPGSRTITHVGLVTVVNEEGVDFIHSSTSLGVVENSLESDYYLSRFIRAVRPRL
jgi:cell wall-associated NlpC family hydrolase